MLRKIATPVIAILIFLALWELLVWANGWPNYKMASPSDLPPAFWKYKELFFVMGWQTLWRTIVGLFLAVIVGTLIGMIIGFSKLARGALYPLLIGFNAIPKATLVPVISLIFIGQHDFNTILMAFMISFFPIAVSVGIGLSTLEPEYRDILRALGASRFTIFRKIALPKTLPEFFGALKVSATLAFIGTKPCGNSQPARAWPRRIVQVRRNQWGLSSNVCGPYRARISWHRFILRGHFSRAHVRRLGR